MELIFFLHHRENIKMISMKKMIAVLVLFFSANSFSQGLYGEVVGRLVEYGTENIIVGVVVYIEDGVSKYQARTDIDGRFRISGILEGTYFLNINNMGDTMLNAAEVFVKIDGIFPAGDVAFISRVQVIGGPTIVVRPKPRIDIDLPTKSLSSKEILQSSAKNDIKSLIVGMSTEARMTDDGELVFRGARKGDMIYLIDGVKTNDAGSIPSSAIQKVMMYTGGLPARFGDTTGGVVVLETKSYFDLYREWKANN